MNQAFRDNIGRCGALRNRRFIVSSENRHQVRVVASGQQGDQEQRNEEADPAAIPHMTTSAAITVRPLTGNVTCSMPRRRSGPRDQKVADSRRDSAAVRDQGIKGDFLRESLRHGPL